jgi:hypothetical protein
MDKQGAALMRRDANHTPSAAGVGPSNITTSSPTSSSRSGEAATEQERAQRFVWLTALLGAVALGAVSLALLSRLLRLRGSKRRSGHHITVGASAPPAPAPPSAALMRAADTAMAVSLSASWTALACALAMQHVSVVGGLSLLCAMFFVLASYPLSPLGFAETCGCLVLPMAIGYTATLGLLQAHSVAIYPFDALVILLAGARVCSSFGKAVGSLLVAPRAYASCFRRCTGRVASPAGMVLPQSVFLGNFSARRAYAMTHAARLVEAKLRAGSAPSAAEASSVRQALSSSSLAAALPALQACAVPLDALHTEAKLGAGATGEVWRGRLILAEHHQQQGGRGRAVAIKRMVRSRVSSAARVEQFLQEGAVLGMLSHPAVVALVGVVLEPPYISLLLELMEGGTLRAALTAPLEAGGRGIPRGTWTGTDTLLRIAIDVCSAVDYLHSRGVCHRDLKAANVLLSGT